MAVLTQTPQDQDIPQGLPSVVSGLTDMLAQSLQVSTKPGFSNDPAAILALLEEIQEETERLIEATATYDHSWAPCISSSPGVLAVELPPIESEV